MYILSDKQMADCRRVLRLIRGHIDYCGQDGLRVYSSAAEVLCNLTNYLERLLNRAKFQRTCRAPQTPKRSRRSQKLEKSQRSQKLERLENSQKTVTGRSRKAKSSPSQTQDEASETAFSAKKGLK